MTSLRVALTEIKRFSGGLLPKLVLIAMLCIPLLYGGIYLYSNWDPYSSVDKVTGALVMSDTGATAEDGKRVATGQQVADELKESADFDWRDYPDRQAAVDDVTTGDIDFALVIPPDFSENLLSTSRFTPDDEGKPGEVDPRAAGIELITNDANNYLLTNIVSTAGTTIRDSVASEVGDETADQLLASLTTIHDQVAEAADGSAQVSEGSIELSRAVDQLKDGSGQLKDGALQLNDGTIRLLDGQDKLLAGAQQGLAGARQLDTGATKVDSGAAELDAGLGRLDTATGQLKTGTADAAKGGTQLKRGASRLATGAGQLKDGTDQLSTGASELADGTAELKAGAKQLKTGTARLNGTLQDSGLGEVSDALTQLCTDLSAINDSEATGQLGTDTADATTQGLDDFETTDLGRNLAQLRTSTCASDGTSSIATKIDSLLSGVAQLDTGAARLSAGVDDANAAARKLSTGAATLDDKTDTLADGADTLSTGATKLSRGLTTLDSKVGQLDTAVGRLSTGADTLHDGTSQLADGTGELVTGVEELVTGQKQARDGTRQLADGTKEAVDGSTKLDDGARQVKDGSDELAEGAKELDDGLQQGARQIPNLDEQERDALASVMSDPIHTRSSSLASGSTYGEGMGPFFMVLALWIGLLMVGQFLRPSNDRALASNTSNLRITLGSWLPFALIGVGQAVILFAVVRLGLGMEMAHPWLALLFMTLVSIAFSAMVQGLISLLESPGKLLVLVLLILQLVTAGGMMPYETLPDSLEWMHHVLPMGYGLTGMRRLIYGVDLGAMGGLVALMALYLVIGLGLSLLGTMRHRTWTLSKLHPEVQL